MTTVSPIDSRRRAVTRGSAVTLVSLLVMRALGFLTSLLLARRLNPESFGVWVILIGFQTVATVVAGLGLPLIAPKFVAEGPAPPGGATATDAAQHADPSAFFLRGFLAAALFLGSVAGLVVAAAAPWLSRVMVGPRGDVAATAWLGFAIAAIVWSTAAGAILQGRHEIRRLAIANMFLAALNLALLIPATRFLGLSGAVIALGIAHSCFALSAIPALPRGLRTPGWSRETAAQVGRALVLGWPLLVSTLLVPLVAWLARTWLGRQAGLDAVGRYQVAETLNQPILLVPMAITMPLYPLIASVARENPREAVRTFSPVFAWVTMVSLPAAIGVGWLAPLWVRLFGPGYHDAAPAVGILSAGFFLSSAGYLTGSFLAGFGQTGRSLLMNALWSILYLAAVAIFVPIWGARGLAAAHAVSYFIYTIFLKIALRRWVGLDIIPAPRLVIGGLILILLGIRFSSTLSTPALLGATFLALLAALALGGSLWRRGFERILSWVRPG